MMPRCGQRLLLGFCLETKRLKNIVMSNTPNNDSDSHFRTTLYQWSARMSGIALEMVIPAAIGIGLDRLCGTVVLFAILGTMLGMALGFWQLLQFANINSGVDTSSDKGDNGLA